MFSVLNISLEIQFEFYKNFANVEKVVNIKVEIKLQQLQQIWTRILFADEIWRNDFGNMCEIIKNINNSMSSMPSMPPTEHSEQQHDWLHTKEMQKKWFTNSKQ